MDNFARLMLTEDPAMAVTPMKPAAPRIFFSDRGDASFIQSDLALLSAFCGVRRHSFRAGKWQLVPALFRSLIISLREVWRADLVICHFGGWSSWLPLLIARALRRPGILVVHGADCVSFPNIGYGNFRKWPLRAVTKACFRSAALVVPVHESLLFWTSDFAPGTPMPQGIRAFMPDLATPVKVLHHGFDPEKWPLGDKVERQGIVTVALQAGSERVKQLKGVDVLIEVARIHPEVPVTIVGLDETHAGTLPKNVTAITRCTPAELARIHQRSRFYLQLSMSEGFGCALAEAMLCGCIPIVSTAGSLPGIVADTGYLVNSRTPDALARSMQLANSEYGVDRPLRARDRIVRGFPLKAREQGWHELVNGLLANS